jgi:4-hydroxy-3-methylbut-2-en-1-yl diphosphate reductase
VTKVHHEVKVRTRKGFTVLYVGHAGHEEAVGTMAVAPDAVRLVESEADLDAVAGPDGRDPGPVALLAQTTLSHDEWSGLMESARRRFPDLWMPGRSDLCFATTNRQDALKALAGKVDAVVVIGSANSSNTIALEKVARAWGCPRVVRVNGVADLPDDLTGTVGVTAGASAPESLVQAVVDALAPTDGVDVLPVTTEDEYFPPPPELRELLRALSTTVGLLAGAGPAGTAAGPAGTRAVSTGPGDGADPAANDPVAGDRTVSAADVLAALAG